MRQTDSQTPKTRQDRISQAVLQSVLQAVFTRGGTGSFTTVGVPHTYRECYRQFYKGVIQGCFKAFLYSYK